ncbi:hypothetical protein pb186bvf_010938 [Paramecium bursaria]
MKIIILILHLIQVHSVVEQVWLRISQITKEISQTEQLTHNICLVDDHSIKIKFNQIFYLTILGNNENIQSISIQENVNQWIQILFLVQQGQIQFENHVIYITENKLINITCKESQKSYDNWFIEVYLQHHKNFILLEKASFYENYDQFIQDNFVSINIWMKQIAEIYRPEYIFIENYENQDSIQLKLYQNNIQLIVKDIQLFQLEVDQTYWYQIVIEFNQNQCLYKILNFENQSKYQYDCNQSKLVSKQLIISTIGSYFHLQIQYDQSVYQCSPGCKKCNQNICMECLDNQYLIRGQCQCNNNYFQNRNGICVSKILINLVYSNLFESNYKIDSDYLQSSCPHGYTQGENKCIECPKWQGEYCFQCLIQRQLNKKLLCEYNSFQIETYLQYELINEEYQIIQEQLDIVKNQNFYEWWYYYLYVQPNQVSKKFHITRQKSKLVNQKLVITQEQFQQSKSQICPFNCDKCQMSNNKPYCLSLIDNQNYTLIQGIPMFNKTYFNTFKIKIYILKNKDIYYFIHNEIYYFNISSILDLINYQSIIISGINIIEVQIYLKGHLDFKYIISQIEYLTFYQRLLININKLYLINIYQTLSIFSDGSPYIINDAQIEFPIVDKFTLSNFKLLCNNSISRFQSQIVILKDFVLTSINESQAKTKINFFFKVSKLVLENINIVQLILENSVIFDIILINNIYMPIINMKTIEINNSTLNQVKLFNLSKINQQNLTVYINYFAICHSNFNQSSIIQLNDLNLDILDFLLFDNIFERSQFIYTNFKNSFVSIQYVYFYENIIKQVKFIDFQSIYIDQMNIISCVFENAYLLFQKQIKNKNQNIRIINFYMEDSSFSKSYLAYIEQAYYVKFENIKISTTKNLNQQILINVQSLQIFIEKIQLTKYQGQLMFLQSDQLTIKYILFQNVSSVETLLHIFTTSQFDLQYIYIDKITCQLLDLQNNVGLINIQKVHIVNISINSTLSYIFQIQSTYRTLINLRYFYILDNIIYINTNFQWLSITGLESSVLIESINLSQSKLQFFSGGFICLDSLQITISKLFIQHLDLRFLVFIELQSFLQLKGQIIEIKNSKFNHVVGNNVIFIQIHNQILCLDLINLQFKNFTIVGTIIDLSLTKVDWILLNNMLFENIQITKFIIKIQISQSYSKTLIYGSTSKNIKTYAHIFQIDQPENSYLVFSSLVFRSITDVNNQNYILNLNIWNVQIEKVFVINTKLGFLIIKCNHIVVKNSQFKLIIFSNELFRFDYYNCLILDGNQFLKINLKLSLIAVYNLDEINYKLMELNNNIFAKIVGESILNVFYADEIIIRSSQFMNNYCKEFCISLASQKEYDNKINIINNKFVNNKAANYLIQFYKNELKKNQTSIEILIKYCIFIISNNLQIFQVLEQNQIQIKNSIIYGLDNKHLANYKLLNCKIIQDDYFAIKKQEQYDLILNINYQIINEYISFTLMKNNQILSNFTNKLGAEQIQNRTQFTIDPYQISPTHLHIICQTNSYELVYQIKAFPCQMGEYYYDQLCKLCDINQYQNSVQKNQNKCFQFSKQQVQDMKQGLLKLNKGFWRPTLTNHYIEQCDKNCLGGWQVGEKSCEQGYFGALCHECDLYNIRGEGSFSKIETQCILCDAGANFIIVFIFINTSQILQIFLTNRIYRQDKNKHYFILRKLEVDQISVSFKILQDVYFKLILISKLQLLIPDFIKIGLNIFPYQIINQGLYCKIHQFGGNILLLELFSIVCITLFMLSVSFGFILSLHYLNYLKYSISYFATTFLHGYKQSFRQISYLLISQLLYTTFSGDYYLVGNFQYKYSEYFKISMRLLPIAIIYFILPLLIIVGIKRQSMYSDIMFNKIWTYMIKDYSSKFQFWELIKLIYYSLFILVYFAYIENTNLKIIICVTIMLFEQYIQAFDCPYTLQNLNNLNRKSQQSLIIMFLLLYIQSNTSQKFQFTFILIVLLNYQMIKSHISNILRVIRIKYLNHYQSILIEKQYQLCIDRFPNVKWLVITKQNSSRAKSSFKNIVQIQRRQQVTKNIFSQIQTTCNSPLAQEIELVEMK